MSEMSGRLTERAVLAKCHVDRQQDNQGNLAPCASLEQNHRLACSYSQMVQAFTLREEAVDAHFLCYTKIGLSAGGIPYVSVLAAL